MGETAAVSDRPGAAAGEEERIVEICLAEQSRHSMRMLRFSGPDGVNVQPMPNASSRAVLIAPIVSRNNKPITRFSQTSQWMMERWEIMGSFGASPLAVHQSPPAKHRHPPTSLADSWR